MEIKIGYKGKFKTIPVSQGIDWRTIKGGIVFWPDNINEEALLEKFIDIIGKYTPQKVDDFLTTIQ